MEYTAHRRVQTGSGMTGIRKWRDRRKLQQSEVCIEKLHENKSYCNSSLKKHEWVIKHVIWNITGVQEQMCVLLKGTMAYMLFLILKNFQSITQIMTKVSCKNSIVIKIVMSQWILVPIIFLFACFVSCCFCYGVNSPKCTEAPSLEDSFFWRQDCRQLTNRIPHFFVDELWISLHFILLYISFATIVNYDFATTC